jgi:hypothetical protein
VEGLLPQGATILAGRPKGGKSWLALQVALAVAASGSLPGGPAVVPGEVLYLALEDTEQRLKVRLERMLAALATPAPTRLSLVTTWRRLEDGGRDDLLAWLGQHAGARLVVVDTLAMLRSRGRGRGYEDDYDTINGLRQLAARFGIALLVVHHVRKAAALDPFDAVLGTHGLTGPADTLWLLARSRAEGEAVLHLRGRDVGEQEPALSWDGDSGLWTLLGPAEERRLSKEQARVLEVLTRAGRPLRAPELAPLLGKAVATTRVLLWRMAEKGLLVSANGGLRADRPGAGERDVTAPTLRRRDGRGFELAETAWEPVRAGWAGARRVRVKFLVVGAGCRICYHEGELIGRRTGTLWRRGRSQ